MGVMEDMTLACCVDSSLPLKKLIMSFSLKNQYKRNSAVRARTQEFNYISYSPE